MAVFVPELQLRLLFYAFWSMIIGYEENARSIEVLKVGYEVHTGKLGAGIF